VTALMDQTSATRRAQGARVVDSTDILPNTDATGAIYGAEFAALLCEFKSDVASYLHTYTGASYPKTLKDLIDFNNAHPELESGAPISDWNSAIFDAAEATNGRDVD